MLVGVLCVFFFVSCIFSVSFQFCLVFGCVAGQQGGQVGGGGAVVAVSSCCLLGWLLFVDAAVYFSLVLLFWFCFRFRYILSFFFVQ